MMTDAASLARQAYELPHGAARTAAYRDAAAQARQEGNVQLEFELRVYLVDAAEYGGQDEEVLVTLPWLLSQHDADPSLWDAHDLLWRYKWFVDRTPSIPQVSLAQLDAFADDFEARSRAQRLGLRATTKLRWSLATQTGRLDLAEQHYQTWRSLERDSMSDCHACDLLEEGEWLLLTKRPTEALEAFEPVLTGRLSCAEEPHRTLAASLEAYRQTDQLLAASRAQRGGYAMIRNGQGFFRQVSQHLRHLAAAGDVAAALTVAERHRSWAEANRFPYAALDHLAALGAVTAAATRTGQPLSLRVPGDDVALTDPTEAATRIRAKAKPLLERFALRDGNSYRSDLFEAHWSTEPVEVPVVAQELVKTLDDDQVPAVTSNGATPRALPADLHERAQECLEQGAFRWAQEAYQALEAEGALDDVERVRLVVVSALVEEAPDEIPADLDLSTDDLLRDLVTLLPLRRVPLTPPAQKVLNARPLWRPVFERRAVVIDDVEGLRALALEGLAGLDAYLEPYRSRRAWSCNVDLGWVIQRLASAENRPTQEWALETEPFIREALAAARRTGDASCLRQTRFLLGPLLLAKLGRPDEALPHLLRLAADPGEDPEDITDSVLLANQALAQLGRYDEAVDLLLDLERRIDPATFVAAVGHWRVCCALMDAGDMDEAVERLRLVVDPLLPAGKYARALDRLSTVAEAMRQESHPDAAALYLEVADMAVLVDDRAAELRALYNAAQLHNTFYQEEKALELISRAEGVLDANPELDTDWQRTPFTLLHAEVLADLGRLDEAQGVVGPLLASGQARLPDDMVPALLRMSQAFLAEDASSALEAAEEAVALAREGGAHLLVAALSAKARALGAAGLSQEAEAVWQELRGLQLDDGSQA